MIAAVLLLHASLLAGPGPQLAQSWDDLSTGQRFDAMRNYQQHESRPPEQQQQVEKQYQKWQQMPEGERNRVRQNFERYQSLPPQQRDEFQQRYERWKQTPRQ